MRDITLQEQQVAHGGIQWERDVAMLTVGGTLGVGVGLGLNYFLSSPAAGMNIGDAIAKNSAKLITTVGYLLAGLVGGVALGGGIALALEVKDAVEVA